MYDFALKDWVPLSYGGELQLFVRPGRPYTLVVDKVGEKICLIPDISQSTVWYTNQYFEMCHKGNARPLNQANVYETELEAVLTERSHGVSYPSFYTNKSFMNDPEKVFRDVFRVTYTDGESIDTGYFGIDESNIHAHILTQYVLFRSQPTNSLAHKKAKTYLTSLVGYPIQSLEQIAHSADGKEYIYL